MDPQAVLLAMLEGDRYADDEERAAYLDAVADLATREKTPESLRLRERQVRLPRRPRQRLLRFGEGGVSLGEACVPNRSGPGHHDDQTGHPCRPGGAETGAGKPGAEPAADAQQPAPSAGEEKVKGRVRRMFSAVVGAGKEVAQRADRLIDQVPVLGNVKRGVARVMKGIYSRLEDRYGPRAAKVMMGSAQLGGFGVNTIFGLTGLGFLIPIPGLADVTALTLMVPMAEVGRQLGLLKGKQGTAEQDESEIVEWVRGEVKRGVARLLSDNKDELLALAESPEHREAMEGLRGLAEKLAA